MFKPEPSYSYQDIALVPLKQSEIESRDHVHTRSLFMGMNLGFPLLGAPMESAVGPSMADALIGVDCAVVLPRRDRPSTNADLYEQCHGDRVIPSIPGVG